MRPEIYYTFERNSVPKYDMPGPIGLEGIKEAVLFFGGMVKEVLQATYEVVQEQGLKAASQQLKSIKDCRLNVIKR